MRKRKNNHHVREEKDQLPEEGKAGEKGYPQERGQL